MRCTYRMGGRRFLPIAMGLLVAALMTGCGSEDIAEETVSDEIVSDDDAVEEEEPEADEPAKDDNDDNQEPEEDEAKVQEAEVMPELTEDEIAALQYVKKVMVEDYFGDQSEYEAFVPTGTEIDNGFVYYYDHGVSYSISVFSMSSVSQLQEYMDGMIEFDKEIWESESSTYSEVEFGDLIEVDEDKYRIASVTKEDYHGTPYSIKKVYYIDYQGHGVGLIWQLEMDETYADDVTAALIDEMGRCYRVHLDEIKPAGEWLAGDAKRREEEQDAYEPGEDEIALEQVDGYRYLGLAMIGDARAEIQCPVLLPMGRWTHVSMTYASADMHGVSVSANVGPLYFGKDFLTMVQDDVDQQYDMYKRDTTGMYRNPQAGRLQSIDGYDMARYIAIDYGEKDYRTEGYIPRTRIFCYIGVQKEYVLKYIITFQFEEYDDATNTLIEELETAYGIDLSEYYYENVQ